MIPAGTVLFRADPVLARQLLTSMTRGGRRLYIFVNGTVSSQINELLAQLDTAVIMRSASNVGQGAALNAIVSAAADAGDEHIVLFDQDSSPDPSYPECLFDAVASVYSEAHLAAAGPRLLPPDGSGYLRVRPYPD